MQEQFYENLEKEIVKKHLRDEKDFEWIAELARDIKREGLKGYEFCQMFEARLQDKLLKKKNS